jgi:hypothetical protein
MIELSSLKGKTKAASSHSHNYALTIRTATMSFIPGVEEVDGTLRATARNVGKPTAAAPCLPRAVRHNHASALY